MYRKEERGITLVALVITIIIIIILSTITLNMAFGDNGLIKQAQKAKDMTANSIASEQEGMNSLLGEYSNIMNGGNEIEEPNPPEKDETPPVVTVTSEETTSNSIKVNVTAIDNESGMVASPTYTYSIKVTGTEDSTYNTPSDAQNITSNTYTFTGLTQGTSYDIKVEVNGDKAGNIGIGYLTNQVTDKVPDGIEQGAITFGNVIWSSGVASVTISTNTSYTIQYQVNNTAGTWTIIGNGGTVNNLNHNDTVYARLYDGTNYGDDASVTVKDTTAPTVNLSTSNITHNSITATVTASDRETGLATSGTYKYYLNNETTPRATSISNIYTFTGLSAKTSYTIKVEVIDKAENVATKTTTATTGAPPDYVDSVLPSAPKVSLGMTPVKWNGNNWIKTTTTDSGWYDYANKQWANVVLGDATFNGSTLDESKPYSMLVWIPRYAYQITSQYHQSGSGAGNINIVFIDTANKNKAGTTTYSETYPSYSTGSGMSDYVVHPAFNYGGTKLPGFWVGKFETSHTGCTTEESTGSTNTNVTTLTAQIKAGVTSWRKINIENIFMVCTELNKEQNPYGLNSDDKIVDPHMAKNTEWGAVAYLSQNVNYGKGSQVWKNNSNNYITGNAGNSEIASADEGNYSYNVGNGPQASTTGNVWGIYDMSGCAAEKVAAYIDNSNAQSYDISKVDIKYRDVYSVGSSDDNSHNYDLSEPSNGHYGDAMWETSSGYWGGKYSWYYDYADYPYTSTPFFTRGDQYFYTTDVAGIFAFDSDRGSENAICSFRVVIPVL